MAQTVGDYLIGRLRAWGVSRIYGYPGDGINGVTSAMRRAGNEPRFMQVPHEELGAFMACAHAKFTGELGVCLATSGPGAIHLLDGLYDARMDHQPVLAIVGQQRRTALGSFYQQEVDLVSLFKDVARDYVLELSVPEQIRHAVDAAVRIARANRTVTCLILPNDLQEESFEPPKRAHGYTFSGVGYSAPRVVPSDDELKRAAYVLNACDRVAILAGAGALNATEELIDAAELLGAGLAKALLGKACVPDDLPFVTGAIGLLGTKPSWEMMNGCDGLFVVGSSFPYSEFLPEEGQARGVQIDLDPRSLSLRYPMEVCLQGDAKETLRALLPYLKRKHDRSWRQRIEESVHDWWSLMEARAMQPASPINPQRVFWELSSRLPDDVILTADSGSVANWYARDLRLRRGMMASLSGNLASMGPGCPYAVAAKLAFPDRPVIALVGDGAMQMNGNNMLVTVEKYWREWKDPRLVIMVLNNRDLNQVTWEQRIMAGDVKFEPSQSLPEFPYAKYAENLGLRGLYVDLPEDLGPAWDAALASDRPVVLEAITDPEVPPLPPHITLEQASGFMKAMLKGDPARWEMLRRSMRQMTA